eukprot:m.15669 g.15669  ORF g.15669 m.15669 type:complete len:309 (+) comp6734_c0_seq1:775-1701(+)
MALLTTFGAVTDVQHADSDDAMDYLQQFLRYYRDAKTKLGIFAKECKDEKVEFVLQLGDFLDGRAKATRDATLQSLMDELASLSVPIHHTWGNHEFYCYSRTELKQTAIHSSPSSTLYYDFTPHPRLRFIVFDPYDISVLGRVEGEPEHAIATALLAARNPNAEKNSPEGLEGYGRRFVAFNGGLGRAQLDWIESVLQDAKRLGQRVILVGHVPIGQRSCEPICLAWNYNEVLGLLHRYPCVVATFAGHDHSGGYELDECGIHHLVLPSVLQTKPGTPCHAVVKVYEDRLVVDGRGAMPSYECRFAKI